MNEIRPLASLTAGLLARKSAARTPVALVPLADKPARRLSVVPESTGWSGLSRTLPVGEAVADNAPADNAPLDNDPGADFPPAAVATEARAAQPCAPSLVVPAVAAQARKVAFTLRIEPKRHGKLRVACALRGRSAQSLLTEAIDRLLAEDPTLAVQVDAEAIGKSVIPS